MPAVSIIIPNKNRADLVAQTLRSVRDQTFGDFECLIIDDGSTDGSPDVIRNFIAGDDRFGFTPLPPGKSGGQAARNAGIAAARGRYIHLLDSDDLLAPWCLSQRVPYLDAHPDLDFAVWPCEMFLKSPGDVRKMWNTLTDENDLDRFLRGDVPWQTSSPLWRTESIRRVGDWDEAVPVAQDWEFHIRALLTGLNYAKLPTQDHYWRMPASDRDSIGRRTFTPAVLRAKPLVVEKVFELYKDSGKLTDQATRVFAGIFFQAAERLAEYVSRSEARALWRHAMELGIITPRDSVRGNRYFMAYRFAITRATLRRLLASAWPAEYLLTKSPTYMNAPAPQLPKEFAA